MFNKEYFNNQKKLKNYISLKTIRRVRTIHLIPVYIYCIGAYILMINYIQKVMFWNYFDFFPYSGTCRGIYKNLGVVNLAAHIICKNALWIFFTCWKAVTSLVDKRVDVLFIFSIKYTLVERWPNRTV